MKRHNIHATALVVGGAGLLILGPSGSGKSLLASTLLESARARNIFAALVSDDRVWLSLTHGRLVAEAPTETAGLIETRGYGLAATCFESGAIVDRLVRLDASVAPRLREIRAEDLAGTTLPSLLLAARNTCASVAAIMAWLDAPDYEPL